MADMLLNKAGVKFDKIDAEENVDMTKEYGVKTAPTMVVMKDGVTQQFVNLSNIKGEIETNFKKTSL
jgi:ribonucleoside-triphosphate reductase